MRLDEHRHRRDVSELPPFPVDDLALSAVETALRYEGGYGLGRVLDFYAGIDPNDRSQIEPTDDPDVFIDHRPHYHPNDVISALIVEVRRLRGEDGS